MNYQVWSQTSSLFIIIGPDVWLIDLLGHLSRFDICFLFSWFQMRHVQSVSGFHTVTVRSPSGMMTQTTATASQPTMTHHGAALTASMCGGEAGPGRSVCTSAGMSLWVSRRVCQIHRMP